MLREPGRNLELKQYCFGKIYNRLLLKSGCEWRESSAGGRLKDQSSNLSGQATLGIDEYLRERLMPVEGAIPHIPGIEMFGNSIPAGTVGGDLFEYINFQQRYDLDARIEQAQRLSKEFLE